MIIRTRKLSDRKVVEIIKSLFKIIPNPTVSGTYFGGLAFKAESIEEADQLSAKSNEKIIEQFAFRAGSTSDEIWFCRGIYADPAQVDSNRLYSNFARLRVADPYFDEVALFEHPQRQNMGQYYSFSADEKLAVARLLDRLRAPIAERGEAEAFPALLDQNLADLPELSTSFIRQMAESRQSDEQAFKIKVEQLEEDFNQRKNELNDKRLEIEKIREEINDREPQHERRKLRKELTFDLQTFLGKPPEGGFIKRNAVHLMYVAVGLIFIAISIFLTIRLDLAVKVESYLFWANTIKAAVSGIGGAAFIWAGLAGLKASTESQRRFSQQLQRYSFDMDRASWVVETLLQMNSMESAQVPDVWLEAACRELFAQEPTTDTGGDSLNALAALLDATARAKVGTDGFEFELNKRALRKLADQAPRN